jgi:flagellar hook protein FlgE
MCINSSNSGPTVYKTGKGDAANTVDNASGFGSLIQGCLEGSNVDLTEQFTDMITATRSFQAASKMITTGDEILQTITGLMR